MSLKYAEQRHTDSCRALLQLMLKLTITHIFRQVVVCALDIPQVLYTSLFSLAMSLHSKMWWAFAFCCITFTDKIRCSFTKPVKVSSSRDLRLCYAVDHREKIQNSELTRVKLFVMIKCDINGWSETSYVFSLRANLIDVFQYIIQFPTNIT